MRGPSEPTGQFLSGSTEHGGRRVDAGHLVATLAQPLCQRPGPAPDLEDGRYFPIVPPAGRVDEAAPLFVRRAVVFHPAVIDRSHGLVSGHFAEGHRQLIQRRGPSADARAISYQKHDLTAENEDPATWPAPLSPLLLPISGATRKANRSPAAKEAAVAYVYGASAACFTSSWIAV